MKFILALTAAAFAGSAVATGYHYDDNNNLVCDKVGSFCSSGPIIIHCSCLGTSPENYAGNCDDNLAGECGQVCSDAYCSQTDPDAGDGKCMLPSKKRGLAFSS